MHRAALLAALALSLALPTSSFKHKFHPGNSTHFDPTKSESFAVVPSAMFFLGYADNSHLKGYQAMDLVQLGDYFAYTKFGAITDCNSPDFNGVDGIVGFGLPVAHPAPPPGSGGGGGGAAGGMGGMAGGMMPKWKMPGVPTGGPPVLPPPLLFSLAGMAKEAHPPKGAPTGPMRRLLTDNAAANAAKWSKDNNVIEKLAFSFLSTDTTAELQLGGYDPKAITGHMFMTPSISVSDYVTVGLSLKYGQTELLDFTTKDPRTAYLPAIMDSGTSCLVIPDSTLGGLFKDKPFSKWKHMVNDTAHPKVKESFFLNIAGGVFEIPYDDWFLHKSNQSCVQRTPKGFSGILVGDVLFRRYLVMFDLTHYQDGQVVIGIAKRNPSYKPASHAEKIRKMPMHKKSGTPQGATAHPRKGPHSKKAMAAKKLAQKHGGGAPPPGKVPHPPLAGDRIPIYNKEDTQYFINVSIGTPRQPFTVIFDTGSAVFGVFSQCDPDAPSFGDCMFGGYQAHAGSAIMDGVIVVLAMSIGFVLIGVAINLYVRKWYDKNEADTSRRLRKAGANTESSYTSERLHQMYGATASTSAAP